MVFKHLIIDQEKSVCTVTLNRPDKLNALNEQLINELAATLEMVASEEQTSVLVVTGAGRAFCAGGDFAFGNVRAGSVDAENAENMSYDDYLLRGHLFRGMQGVILALRKLEIPTIAMVNGPAVGAGFDLALACDLRTGSKKTRFMVALTRMGLNPGVLGGAWLLPRVIGLSRALDLFFTARFCEAEEAYRIGLLDRLVSEDELGKATMDLAHDLAKGPPISLRLAKMQAYKGCEIDFETAVALGHACENICLRSEDHKEGIRAFAEKRPPEFKGK